MTIITIEPTDVHLPLIENLKVAAQNLQGADVTKPLNLVELKTAIDSLAASVPVGVWENAEHYFTTDVGTEVPENMYLGFGMACQDVFFASLVFSNVKADNNPQEHFQFAMDLLTDALAVLDVMSSRI